MSPGSDRGHPAPRRVGPRQDKHRLGSAWSCVGASPCLATPPSQGRQVTCPLRTASWGQKARPLSTWPVLAGHTYTEPLLSCVCTDTCPPPWTPATSHSPPDIPEQPHWPASDAPEGQQSRKSDFKLLVPKDVHAGDCTRPGTRGEASGGWWPSRPSSPLHVAFGSWPALYPPLATFSPSCCLRPRSSWAI